MDVDHLRNLTALVITGRARFAASLALTKASDSWPLSGGGDLTAAAPCADPSA